MDIPPQCQGLAVELSELRHELIAAQQDLANARGSEKQFAGQRVNELRARVNAKSAEFDKCRGCLSPLNATWEDQFGFTSSVTVMYPSILPGTPSFTSNHLDELSRGLSFTFTGCDHEYISPRSGWRMLFNPFPFFTMTVPRRFPDIFGPGGVIITTPYIVTVSPIGEARVLSGRFDRSSGHLDLLCDVTLGWLPFGNPPAYLNWLYGLDFGRSTIQTVFTTRTVPKTVAPTGPALSGSPLTPPSQAVRLVASRYLHWWVRGQTTRGVRVLREPRATASLSVNLKGASIREARKR